MELVLVSEEVVLDVAVTLLLVVMLLVMLVDTLVLVVTVKVLEVEVLLPKEAKKSSIGNGQKTQSCSTMLLYVFYITIYSTWT